MASFQRQNFENINGLQRASQLPVPAQNLPGMEGGETGSQKTDEERVCGETLRIVYCSPDGGYCVIRLKDDLGNNQTLVGPMGGIAEGMNIEAVGHWENHRDHGRQFRVSSFCSLMPKTKSGIEKYLSSGILPGVGEVTASRIVAHFGESTLEILDHAPDRLKEVEGIGRKKANEIKANWKSQNSQRDSMIFLQGLGISPTICNKIITKYSASMAGEIVRTNPYRLVNDIEGIGFTTADRIASGLGIANNHPKRLCAGIVYTLEHLGALGNVCCPDGMLVDKAADILKVSIEDAWLGLQIGLDENRVQAEHFPQAEGVQRMIYLRKMHQAETTLAKNIRLLGYTKFENATVPPVSSGPKSVRMNQEQTQGYNNAFTHSISIITGGPGVGKTTVVSQLVHGAHKLGLHLALAAPTGRAAKRMTEATGHDATTIHRLLKWEPESRSFAYNEDNQLECEMLVVDEVSMLDISLADSLFRAIKPGTRLVLVGDKDQLPSVGPGNVLQDLINCGLVPVTYLTEIYRQANGSRIIVNAHRVNRGDYPDISQPECDCQSDFYWIEQNDPDRVAEMIQKMYMERIPNAFDFNPMSDIQILSPMHKGNCGVDTLNRALQEVINPPAAAEKPQVQVGEKIFRLGDKVMQISNNYDKMVFNGEMGRIVSFDVPGKSFAVLFDHNRVEYKYNETDQLELSYAVTVHKSQGSEFPVVIMPMINQHYMMLQRNLLYTGMTRAKKLLVLIGSQQALRIAINNNEPTRRISMLKERLK